MADSENTTSTSRRVKLTDRYIANLKPAPNGKRVTIWDDVESGLGVTVQPTGHRSFVVVRRLRGSGPVKVTLKPPYPTLGLAQARQMAVAYKVELANGTHPRHRERAEDAERERLKAEETRVSFHQVAEAFIKRKLVGLRSAALIEAVIRKDVLSQPWARKPVAAVSKSDIVSMINGIRTDRERSKPGQWSTPAMRSYNYARAILSWAQKRDEYSLDVNVADKIDLGEEMSAEKRPARERVLSDAEFAAFWRACQAEGYPGGCMLQILALSCCRLREVAHAEWSELSVIDGAEQLSGPVLTVPSRRMKGRDGRTDPHTVPLTPLMESIFDSLPRFAGAPRFIFSNRGGRSPMSGFGQLKDRIDARMREELGQELSRWTFHDLRRSGRSNLSRLGVPADIGERCLAHRTGGIRGVYDKYQFLSEKRVALTKLSELVERIIDPTPNVLEFKPPAVLTAS